MKKEMTPANKTLELAFHLVLSGQTYSLTQLSKELDCSKSTVIRHMRDIEAAFKGGCRREKRDGQLYYTLTAPYAPPQLSLSAESLQYLLFCRDLVQHMLPPSMDKKVREAIERATVLLPKASDRGPALSHVASALPKGRIDYASKQPFLESLLRAIRERCVCQVTYKTSSTSAPRVHHFAALRVVALHDALYVEGFTVTNKGAVEEQHELTLAVHRIQDVTETIRVHALTLEDLPEDEGFGLMRDEPFRVCVRFNDAAAQYVREREWSKDQEIKELKDGGVKLSFTGCSELEVLAMVLSFGAAAKLLEPKSLVRRLTKTLDEMVESYRPKTKQRKAAQAPTLD